MIDRAQHVHQRRDPAAGLAGVHARAGVCGVGHWPFKRKGKSDPAVSGGAGRAARRRPRPCPPIRAPRGARAATRACIPHARRGGFRGDRLEALLAEQLAVPAGLDQAVGVREHDVARVRAGRGPRTRGSRRSPAGIPARRLLRLGARAQEQRGQMAGVRVPQPLGGEKAEEGGHEGVAREALAQQRVRLAQRLRRPVAVPAPRLDEEAGHGAHRRGRNALARHVAHQQSPRSARSVQAPYTSPPAGWCAAGSYSSPTSQRAAPGASRARSRA